MLSLINIHKSYNSKKILNNISLEIKKGQIVGLIGLNGAGKTTLLRLITGITQADEGEILFNDEKWKFQHSLQIGYLPEERGLYKNMTVKKLLCYFAGLKEVPSSIINESIQFWLKRLELEDKENCIIANLSKGQQQKIQFIAAIIHKPALIILDEPFTGFDPINAQIIKAQIQYLKSLGYSFIISTHRMESVEELCETVYFLHNQEFILQGNVNDIITYYSFNEFEIHTSLPLTKSTIYRIISSEQVSDDCVKSIIKIEDTNLNLLLKEMLEKNNQLIYYKKIRLSMNDIFIKNIQG